MKQFFFILTFVLLISFAFSQTNKTVYVPTYQNGDTTHWYKWHNDFEDKLKLNHLINLTDTFHFRFWTYNQAIEIWTSDYKTFSGISTNFAKKLKKNFFDRLIRKLFLNYRLNHSPTRLYFNKVQLDTSTTRQIFELVKTIDKIPSDNLINGWNSMIIDGFTYKCETSTMTSYNFKTYGNPTDQDSLIEGKIIKGFIDQILSIPVIVTEYSNFFKSLPPGTYEYIGCYVKTKLSSRQERRLDRYAKKQQ